MVSQADPALVTVDARHLIAWDVHKILDIEDLEAQAPLAQWIDTYYPDPAPTLSFERVDDLFVACRWSPPASTWKAAAPTSTRSSSTRLRG